MSYYNRLNNILRQIKTQDNIPHLMVLIKNVGDKYYRFNNKTKNELFIDISDDELFELKFIDDVELLDYMRDRAYKIGIPMHQINKYKPLMISIKDNTYLERCLYDANRG